MEVLYLRNNPLYDFAEEANKSTKEGKEKLNRFRRILDYIESQGILNPDMAIWLYEYPRPEQVDYAIEHLDFGDFERWDHLQYLLFRNDYSKSLDYKDAARIIDALWENDIEILEINDEYQGDAVKQFVFDVKIDNLMADNIENRIKQVIESYGGELMGDIDVHDLTEEYRKDGVL